MTQCVNKCKGCNRELRHGSIVVVDPLLTEPKMVDWDVCQKERSGIMADGSMVKLARRVVIAKEDEGK